MGSNVLVFAETSNAIHGDIATPLSRRPVLQAGQWAEFGRRMSEVADATLREGVRLVYHHHMGTVVQDEADIDALMANTSDAVHLLLDTFTGPVWWLAPFVDEPFSLFIVGRTYELWWLNFVLNWSFLLETALLAAAVIVYVRDRQRRHRVLGRLMIPPS